MFFSYKKYVQLHVQNRKLNAFRDMFLTKVICETPDETLPGFLPDFCQGGPWALFCRALSPSAFQVFEASTRTLGSLSP